MLLKRNFVMIMLFARIGGAWFPKRYEIGLFQEFSLYGVNAVIAVQSYGFGVEVLYEFGDDYCMRKIALDAFDTADEAWIIIIKTGADKFSIHFNGMG